MPGHGAGDIAPPPASIHHAGPDSRNVRHGCGVAYNGYLWERCPKCQADERGHYALRCCACGHPFHDAERVALCPACGSGETTVYYTPEQPAIR